MKRRTVAGKMVLAGVAMMLGWGVISPTLVKFAAADGGYTLTFTVQSGTNHTIQEDQGHLKIDGQYVDLRNGNETIGVVACDDEPKCTITVADGTAGQLSYYSAESFTLYVGGQAHNFETEFSGDASFVVQDYEESGGPGPASNFSGNAWFFWNCDGEVCKYKATNLTPAVEDPDTHIISYHTNYIKATDVIDSDSGRKPELGSLKENEDYFWVWEDKGNNVTYTSWADFLAYVRGLDYDDMRDFAIDPTGAENGNNSVSTNGDRAFRATIYDESNYFGISNGSSVDDLTYYPDFWDTAFFNPAHDLSGTTLEDPAIIQTYLLEPTIILESDGVSDEITKIEIADDTPAAVANITESGGKWTIEFQSNFFDRTVFKVTSSSGEYYMRLMRITVDAGGGVYVPANDQNDYSVYASATLNNGTELSAKLVRNSGDDASGGKGLNYVAYDLSAEDWGKIGTNPEDENFPSKLEYSVVKDGSTSEHYAGTLAGSGKGTGYVMTEAGFVIDAGEK